MGRRAAAPVRRAGEHAARGRGRRARSTARCRRRSASRACRSPASPAISRRRSSARCAASRACRRTPTAPAASCCRTSARQPTTSRHQLLTTVAWQIGGRTEYALEGSVFIGGAVVQWLRDGLGLIRTRARDRGARGDASPTTAASISCRRSPASGAPHWDPVRARHDRRHHARHDGGAHRARRAREHRVPGRRSARRDARRRRHRAHGAARRRRRRRPTTC